MSDALWIALLALLVVVQIAVIWSIRRHRDPALHIDCDSPIDQLMPSLSGLTLGTAVAGNRVDVLENGAFFDVLIERIGAARHSVHFETFLWKDGELGDGWPTRSSSAHAPRCRCACCSMRTARRRSEARSRSGCATPAAR